MSKTTNKARMQKTVRLVELALLTAIIAVMTFTPIGYLKLGPLELTLIMVPVIIGAVTLGPAAGAFLGLVFGASSFIQCFSLSAFGAILISISVFKTLVVCVVPRVLAGWLTGLIFNAVTKKTKKDGFYQKRSFHNDSKYVILSSSDKVNYGQILPIRNKYYIRR